MVSDVCFELEDLIKYANEEIKIYLNNPNYAYNDAVLRNLIKKNEEYIEYLRNFRMQPGFDSPPIRESKKETILILRDSVKVNNIILKKDERIKIIK